LGPSSGKRGLSTSKIKQIVDLSQLLFNDMPTWQTNPDLKYDQMQKVARDLFNVTVIRQMHMHTGAHVDVPLHSIQQGKTVDQFPIDKFMGEGVVLDFRKKKPAEEITRDDLKDFDNSILGNDVVMLCTDWSKKVGYNSDFLYKWPFPNIEACKYLVEKGVKAVGTEGLSIAGWTGNVRAQGPVTNLSSADIHNTLLERDILIIEGLANLSEILKDNKSARAFFIFAPVKFAGVEAAPCRASALIFDD
jgi:arylformamidase